MRRFISALFGGRLQLILIASFSFVAALTVGVGAVVTSWMITDYLDRAMNERVARDMKLADAFYRMKQEEIVAISRRLVLDSWVKENLRGAVEGRDGSARIIDQQITNKISVLSLGGTHLIAAIDAQGNIVAGRALSAEGELSPTITSGSWGDLGIIKSALSAKEELTGTEVVPMELLASVDLREQAFIAVVETPMAAPELYNPAEGTAGLAIISVSPMTAEDGQISGAILSMYLLNNDIFLVDRIKELAGIDAVTIFFGDMRIATNVMTEQAQRAVGTRISQDVYDVVLRQKQNYVGRAFVVNDWYLTRYEPLSNHKGEVVGSLYVGAREAAFLDLVTTFNNRVILIALVCIGLSAVIAVPIARLITRPIANLSEASSRLARGDMRVHVQTNGIRELALLGQSFNRMVETLRQTQQELLHKERLASMGQLAAGVAHEINNPLGTILLFSEAMRDEAAESDPRRADLEMIIAETVRCKNIVADLLNFSRQQQILAQATDLHELLDRIMETLSHQPAFQQIEFLREYSPEISTIEADPAQLQQVFINLFTNAAEAIIGFGIITVATRIVAGEWVEIKVSDTGCGIPDENRGKLFTPFFTTKSPGKGTGLGLSIIYGIIKIHRGQINVDSQVGKGTTFTVTLPMRPQPEAPVMIGS
jgi:two-component system NtrC family sensor kinase